MRLTRSEADALDELTEIMRVQLAGLLSSNNPPRETVTIFPKDANVMIRTNLFLVRALHLLSNKAGTTRGGMRRADAARAAMEIREVNSRIRETLKRRDRVAPLIITGKKALVYYALLEWAHSRYTIIRKNYMETAEDLDEADRRAKEALWVIRSLINVGHPPVEISPWLR